MSLNQINLYRKSNSELNNVFLENVESTLTVHTDINRIQANTQEWIDMILFSIPYVLKALERPNKQIITEEEIVKIELVKKVSIESIKHLSKNTNFIDEIDEETGDVTPSKLLEAFKEENFVTYENRFIYTLVLLINDFINYKKNKGLGEEPEKNIKKIEFEGKTRINKERISIKSEIVVDQGNETGEDAEKEKREQQLQKIADGMEQLKSTEMFKLLQARRATLVKPPLKMTNVLLKNVNFQYAVKLWNFLNDNFVNKNDMLKEKKDYEDKGILSTMFNETFLLNYLDFDLIDTKDKKETAIQINEKEVIKKITQNLMMRILELNPTLTEQQLKELLAENYIKMRNKYSTNTKQIEQLFCKNIKSYMEKLRSKEVHK